MAKTDPAVSIITPLYNCAEYIGECIESVIAQTYENWEYIIVNNCSTDGSGDIARSYAKRDSRIRVIENKQFLTAIPNQNEALRQISRNSKYCKVVFADDWIFPECIERMVSVAEKHPSIGIVGAYVLNGTDVMCTGLSYRCEFSSGSEICRQHLLKQLYVFGSANGVLYRADLVRDREAFYNEAEIHADTEICFSVLRDNDFGFVHQILTFTRVRSRSLSTISTALQTDFAGMLRILRVHGPFFLSQDELEDLTERHMHVYYKFLGKSLLLGNIAVLNFHGAKLRESKIGFSRSRVLKGVLSTLSDWASAPKSSIQKLVKIKKQRLHKNQHQEQDFLVSRIAKSEKGDWHEC